MSPARGTADDRLRSAHSRFVETEGHRFHVQVSGTGPRLLLLHGTGACSQSFRDLIPRLSPHFTVVAPDLPGQGLSVAPRRFVPSLEGMASALAGLNDALGPADLPLVAGHSAGAAILAEMIRRGAIAPDRLVGIAAAMIPFDGIASLVFPSMARWMSRSSLAAGLVARRMGRRAQVDRVLRGTGSHLPAENVEVYRQLNARPGHVAAVIAMMAEWDLAPLFEALPDLHVPVTLIAGERDQAVPLPQLRRVARRLAEAELVVIPGVGHVVHEERPETVARRLLSSAAGQLT